MRRRSDARVVRHVGNVHDAAVNGRRGCRAKILFMDFAFAHVIAGVDVNIAHAGEDEALVAELHVGPPELRTNFDDLCVLNADLTRRHPAGAYESAGNNHVAVFQKSPGWPSGPRSIAPSLNAAYALGHVQ